jgi:hypothetical protein
LWSVWKKIFRKQSVRQKKTCPGLGSLWFHCFAKPRRFSFGQAVWVCSKVLRRYANATEIVRNIQLNVLDYEQIMYLVRRDTQDFAGGSSADTGAVQQVVDRFEI